MNVSRIASVLCLLVFASGTATAQETAPAMTGWKTGPTLPKTGATLASTATTPGGRDKQVIKAIYIPLADHYAGIIAYEKYRDKMQLADYQIRRMKSWPLLRSYFMSGEADMAYVMCPLAMDMFRENPNFRWIGLMLRDGNALATNDLFNVHVDLPAKRIDRKPDVMMAPAFATDRGE